MERSSSNDNLFPKYLAGGFGDVKIENCLQRLDGAKTTA